MISFRRTFRVASPLHTWPEHQSLKYVKGVNKKSVSDHQGAHVVAIPGHPIKYLFPQAEGTRHSMSGCFRLHLLTSIPPNSNVWCTSNLLCKFQRSTLIDISHLAQNIVKKQNQNLFDKLAANSTTKHKKVHVTTAQISPKASQDAISKPSL